VTPEGSTGHFHFGKPEFVQYWLDLGATSILIDECDATKTYQSWNLVADNRITNAADGRCIDIDYCANNTEYINHVSVYPCTTNSTSECSTLNEQWVYIAANSSIITVLDGQCLTVDNRNGINVGTLPCNASLAAQQTWTYNPSTKQYVSGAKANYCLSVFQDVAPGALEVWSAPLSASSGSYAVVLFNRSPANSTITANWTDLGLNPSAQYAVRDLWAHADLGTFSGSFSALVPTHGVSAVKLTPA
jgi:hypothetical protein